MESHFQVFLFLVSTAFTGQEPFAARLRSARDLQHSGDYAGAEQILLRALKDPASFGPDDLRSGIVLHELGLTYHSMGRYPEAERCYRGAIERWKRIGGGDGRALAQSTRCLAALYLDTGQNAKAERLDLPALATRLQTAAPGSAVLAGLTGTLGALALAQGRFTESEAGFQKALRLWEQIAPDSLESMQILNNLGLLYEKTARFDDALRAYQRALRVSQRTLPSGHPESVQLLANLGALKFQMLGPREAQPFYREALVIAEARLGTNHPLLGAILRNYAVVLRQLGQGSQARACERRAREISQLSRDRDPRKYTVDVSELPRTR